MLKARKKRWRKPARLLPAMRRYIALRAGFILPSEDGFWGHEKHGPIHDDALDFFLHKELISYLEKIGL